MLHLEVEETGKAMPGSRHSMRTKQGHRVAPRSRWTELEARAGFEAVRYFWVWRNWRRLRAWVSSSGKLPAAASRKWW